MVDGERRVAALDGHTEEIRGDRIGRGVEDDHVQQRDEACGFHGDLARGDAVGASDVPANDVIAPARLPMHIVVDNLTDAFAHPVPNGRLAQRVTTNTKPVSTRA